eukprot:m.217180 g.217180  ORF g.217180 m.217180 type:complete len:712 (+) comp18664_c0_seq22:683-2818(+)
MTCGFSNHSPCPLMPEKQRKRFSFDMQLKSRQDGHSRTALTFVTKSYGEMFAWVWSLRQLMNSAPSSAAAEESPRYLPMKLSRPSLVPVSAQVSVDEEDGQRKRMSSFVAKSKPGFSDEDVYEKVNLKQPIYDEIDLEDDIADEIDTPSCAKTEKVKEGYARWRLMNNSLDDWTALKDALLDDPMRNEEVLGLVHLAGKPAPPDPKQPEAAVAPPPLWRERPEAAPLLATLSKAEVHRQEAIAELIVSEQHYLQDVAVLLKLLVQPLLEHVRQCEAVGKQPMIDSDDVLVLVDNAQNLERAGCLFLEELEKRRQENVVVKTVADVLQRWSRYLLKAFYAYCDIAVQVRSEIDLTRPDWKELLHDSMKDPLARNLPIDAFLICPVQRLARYPLLIKQIVDKTPEDTPDRTEIEAAFASFSDIVERCNERMSVVQDKLQMMEIQQSLDFSRLENAMDLTSSPRSLVKKGLLHLVAISNNKIVKAKKLEFMLFSDILLLAKRVRVRATGEFKFLVYQQVHRSLLDVIGIDDLSSAASDQNLIQLKVFVSSGVNKLFMQLPSPADKSRWLDAFNPAPSSASAVFSRPLAKVIRAHDAGQMDELTVREGERVHILDEGNGDGWVKARLERPPSLYSRNIEGWVPASFLVNIKSVAETARALRDSHKRSGRGYEPQSAISKVELAALQQAASAASNLHLAEAQRTRLLTSAPNGQDC